MNILLWVLQILLALHTGAGAAWKLSHPAQDVPSLQVIPHGVWMAMSGIEILCALGLILPLFKKSWGYLVPLAAGFIVAEMLLYCGLTLFSSDVNAGHIGYWLVVAALAGLIAYGRRTRHEKRG